MPVVQRTAWFWFAGALIACGSGTSDLFDESASGSLAKGGAGGEASGGKAAAGGASGGRAQGGAASGGASGGAPTGGSANGGQAGQAEGGAEAGGTSSGGTSSGGTSGGSVTGGGPSGGSSSGNAGMGGTSTGGAVTVPTGGKGSGGASSMKCSDPDGSDFQTRGTAKGTNGSFQDECQQGELVEYVCETTLVISPDCAAASARDAAAFRPLGGRSGIVAPPMECQMPTGRVIESNVDCGGRCRDGTCFYWCPRLEDEVRYVRVRNGEVRVENTTSSFRYQCEVEFERDGFDCTDPELEGQTVGVFALGACTTSELVFATESSRSAGVQDCTYRCVLVD